MTTKLTWEEHLRIKDIKRLDLELCDYGHLNILNLGWEAWGKVYWEKVLWADGGLAEKEVEGIYPPRIYLICFCKSEWSIGGGVKITIKIRYYERINNLTEKELSKKLGIDQAKTEYILFCHIDKIALDELTETIGNNLSSLILIKTNQTEKVKKILEKEKVGYEIYSSETNLKAKSSSKNVKELVNSLDKARINCKSIFIPNKGAKCLATCLAQKLEAEHKKITEKMIASCFPKRKIKQIIYIPWYTLRSKKEFFETNPHEAGHITAFEKKFALTERKIIKKMYELRDKYETRLVEEYELVNYYEEYQKIVDRYQA
ncbi:46_t:CDS:2 [Funneliformis geosporum]|nr:46_t:CDS:2 [Funneliformis geosporum]